jgi:glycosyltransferase involved in cell wall biosynthesis
MRKKILIFCDYFYPGFKAGGPITTLKSTISQLSSDYSFNVVTRNHDYQDVAEYPHTRPDTWRQTPYGEVYYSGSSLMGVRQVLRIIRHVGPDIIYLNSLFSVKYSFMILLVLKFVLRSKIKIVLCPRGELNQSALNYSKFKKKSFLSIFKVLGLHRFVFWQATNLRELNQVDKIFGIKKNVLLAPNLTWGVNDGIRLSDLGKSARELKIIFVARINDLKNLKLLLKVISKRNWNVQLDIAGPIDEKEYWEKCQEVIAQMDTAVSVNYLGEIENIDILDTIANYHCLCLPTRGENFGQVIYEALSIGRPVIISDQTPWINLESVKAGFDVDITSETGLDHALQEMYHFNEEQWLDFCEGALILANGYFGSSRKDTVELFQRA